MSNKAIRFEKMAKAEVAFYTKKAAAHVWRAHLQPAGKTDYVTRWGAEKLVQRAVEDIGEVFQAKGIAIPYNLHTWGPLVSQPQRRKLDKDQRFEAYALMGGWLRSAAEIIHEGHAEGKVLARVLKGGLSANGQNSPHTTIDLWKLVGRMSPGEFARRARKIQWRANEILSPLGIRVSWRALAAAVASPGANDRRKAFMAAAGTLCGETPRTYRRAIVVLASPEEWASTPGELAVKARNRGAAVRYLGRFAPDVAEGIPEALSKALAPEGELVVRTWRRLSSAIPADDRPHAMLALCKIFRCFGRDGLALVNRVEQGLISVHDAGINLPLEGIPREASQWALERLSSDWERVVRVASAWASLLAEGWNPVGKAALTEGEDILKAVRYKGARSPGFARLASSLGVSQHTYGELEARWLAASWSIQTVPAPGGIGGLSKDGYRLTQLAKSDPRALWAGALTGCCQHPEGVASVCAWHAHESPDGAIWALERNGSMLAQAWVWRDGDALCLDNIEVGRIARVDQHLDYVRELFTQAANTVIGKLGIATVYLGTGFMTFKLEGFEAMKNPLRVPVSYTDARTVWRIA